MKQQGNSSHTKANYYTIKASKNSEEEKISTNEFKEAMIKIMNKFRDV
jgi:hypothetical protein